MISFLKTIVYIPLYNALILLLNIPFVDVGIAVIILTVLVKIILYPLSKKTSLTQLIMKQKEGELAEIKKKYPDTQEQAVKVMEFYKINNINPFSGLVTLFIQIPVIYSLYHIFYRSGLPTIDPAILYSFIKIPTSVSMYLFGLIDVSQKSVIFAIIAAISTYFQMHVQQSSSGQKTPVDSKDFSQVLGTQMKYTMPIVIFFVSWKISAVVALYWIVSNIAGMVQDMYIKKQLLGNSQKP